MRLRARLVCVALLLTVPLPALSWRAWNRHEVFALGNGVFEVLSEPGSGAADFWCGIGDYAQSQLRAAATQRIYVWRAIGPSVTRPNHRAMQFAFAPPKGADTSTPLTLSTRRVGDNLSVASARQYCFGGKFDPLDRWFW